MHFYLLYANRLARKIFSIGPRSEIQHVQYLNLLRVLRFTPHVSARHFVISWLITPHVISALFFTAVTSL